MGGSRSPPFTPSHIAMLQAEKAREEKVKDDVEAAKVKEELEGLKTQVGPPPAASCSSSPTGNHSLVFKV